MSLAQDFHQALMFIQMSKKFSVITEPKVHHIHHKNPSLGIIPNG
jgi:hypothetical protein